MSVARVLILLLMIPALWLGFIPVAAPAVYVLIVLFGAYVIVLAAGPEYLPFLRNPDLVVVLDMLVITLVVVISGTINSPFLTLFYLAVLEATFTLNLKQALWASVAVAAILILLLLYAGRGALLEQPGFRIGAFVAGGFVLALVLGVLVQEHQRASEMAAAYDATLEGWSRALDLRDRETEDHSWRVAELTLRLARAMKVSDADLVHLRRGALLHDIGKLAISDSILHKPAALTSAEGELMNRHPAYAYRMLFPIGYLRRALDIPYCHHEKWDGTGYPRRLRGEEIPLAARIFAVIDVWDALRSDRPYRAAWTAAQAREYIQAQAGEHFDPRVVDVFFQLEREGQLEVGSSRPAATRVVEPGGPSGATPGVGEREPEKVAPIGR